MITFPAKKKQSLLLPLLFLAGLFGSLILGIISWSTSKPTAQLAAVITSTPTPASNAASPTPVPTPTPTSIPSPTPRPLTFAEMNEKFGPCAQVPVLMYHHIQTEDQAKARGQTGLTVYTSIFKEQMSYLKDKGYTTIDPNDLISFFDSEKTLPEKPILITVDDGYDDNYTDMFPILKELNFKATIFLATGLVENAGYMKWAEIAEMAKSGMYFGNHTWSHQNMKTRMDKIEYELSTAQNQLSERGLNQDKVFAFPYGLVSGQADEYLNNQGYKLAFDTLPGRFQCAQQKYSLPRIRVGNTKLSSYGL